MRPLCSESWDNYVEVDTHMVSYFTAEPRRRPGIHQDCAVLYAEDR